MTTLRKSIAMLFSLILVISLFSGCGSRIKEIDRYEMRENMSIWDFRDEMGLGLNLGNTMEAYNMVDGNATSGAGSVGDNTISDFEKCWGAQITTQEIIDGMCEAGFNTVRIPVYWGNGMEDDGEFNIRPDLMDRVEEIVNYCLNDGLYVVVNMHHYDERLIKFHNVEDTVAAVGVLWTQIAEHFKDYGDHLIFEGFNEALGNTPDGLNLNDNELYDFVNAMNQAFVDAVRATGGNNANRVLIASGYWTNIDKTTSWRWHMPKDTVEDRLMVSVHYVDNMIYWSNQIGTDWWLDYSKAQCELLKARFTDNGIPVFVGECTASYADRIAQDAKVTESWKCLQTILEMEVKDYGFIPVIWDTQSDHSFYSRPDCAIADPNNAKVIEKLS